MTLSLRLLCLIASLDLYCRWSASPSRTTNMNHLLPPSSSSSSSSSWDLRHLRQQHLAAGEAEAEEEEEEDEKLLTSLLLCAATNASIPRPSTPTTTPTTTPLSSFYQPAVHVDVVRYLFQDPPLVKCLQSLLTPTQIVILGMVVGMVLFLSPLFSPASTPTTLFSTLFSSLLLVLLWSSLSSIQRRVPWSNHYADAYLHSLLWIHAVHGVLSTCVFGWKRIGVGSGSSGSSGSSSSSGGSDQRMNATTACNNLVVEKEEEEKEEEQQEEQQQWFDHMRDAVVLFQITHVYFSASLLKLNSESWGTTMSSMSLSFGKV